MCTLQSQRVTVGYDQYTVSDAEAVEAIFLAFL